jgi:hypothetical protein
MALRRACLPTFALLALGCSAPAGTAPQQSASPGPVASASSSAPASPAASPAIQQAFKLSGKVLDEDLGAVADAKVSATVAGGTAVSATTNASGEYTLSLPAGNYEVTASKAGWITRKQNVALSGDAVLHFGGIQGDLSNPYFLSNVPEIERVDVKEDAPSGPVKIVLRLSEPVSSSSQANFLSRLEVAAGYTNAFLTLNGAPDELLKATGTWDAAGQEVTINYPGPYLAGGTTPVVYTVRLHQEPLDKKDPVTQVQLWDDLGVKDAEGHLLGYNRADYAFTKPALFPIDYQQLANKDFGYTPSERRWSLTHQSSYTYTAAKDEKGPGLESVRVNTNMQIGSGTWDVLEMHFTEPMWAVKDRDHLQFTQLDKDKQLVLLSVSEAATGSNPQAFDTNFKVQTVRFSRLDPKVVYLHYSPGAFKDKKWVEVTLGVDLMDPAGNKADSAKSRVAGPVS